MLLRPQLCYSTAIYNNDSNDNHVGMYTKCAFVYIVIVVIYAIRRGMLYTKTKAIGAVRLAEHSIRWNKTATRMKIA